MPRPITEKDVGLKVLHDPSTEESETTLGKLVDIVAVHGMGAHPDDTWCKTVHNDGKDKTYINWLEEPSMLPAAVPNARIMRYGYESQWFGEDSVKTKASNICERFLPSLKRSRKECSERPLIFIAHSFGGLVVLKTLVRAREEKKWSGIYNSVIGLVFFGTPFRGTSDVFSQGEILQLAEERFGQENLNGENLRILRSGDESLQDLVDSYLRISSESIMPNIACFFEQKRTDVGAILGNKPERLIRKTFLVDENSGCLDLSASSGKYPLSRTHFDMNKFGSPDEEDFMTLCEVLEEMVQKGPSLIAKRNKLLDAVQKYFEVPPLAVSRFFGRQELLHELEVTLQHRGDADRPQVVVLHAMGGQGKSQTALEYCRKSRESHRGVFWIDATSRATTERNMEAIAFKINRPVAMLLEDTSSKVQLVLDTIQDWKQKWLIVLDNFDQPDVFSDIRKYIPMCGNGSIIVTTRHEGARALGRLISVPPMTNDGGIELLLRDLPEDESEQSISHGKEIVERLGGLALAIEQAAAYINYRKISIAQFLPEYEKNKKKVLRHKRELWEYQKQLEDTEKEIALTAFTTWEMSFQQIERHDEIRRAHIARFLGASAFLEPSKIEESLFRVYFEAVSEPFSWLGIFTVSDEEVTSEYNSVDEQELDDGKEMRPSWKSLKFWDVIYHLRQLSVLQSAESSVLGSDTWFSIHPLIRDWLQIRERTAGRKQLFEDSVKLVGAVAGSVLAKTSGLEVKEQLLGHLRSLLSCPFACKGPGSIGSGDMREETVAFGRLFLSQGKYKESEHLFDRLLAWDRSKLEQDHADTTKSMENLALTYMNQGRWNEAEQLQVQVMETRKRTLGQGHPDTLNSIGNLASTYYHQGRWKEAEELEVQVMEISASLLGQEHPSTLASMANLASTYSDQGRWSKAEALEVKVMETSVKVLGKEHPDTLTSMANLASTYWSQGKWKKAEELGVQVMEASIMILGQEHPDTLTNMANLASTYTNQGRLKDAEELGAQVVEMSIRVLGDEHPDTLTRIGNLASTYEGQKRWKEAEELEVQVAETMRRVLGQEHPDTLTSIGNLALTYGHQGRWKEAEELGEHVVESSIRTLGQEHPSTLTGMENLASAYSNQERWEEAEKLWIQVIERRNRVLGQEHHDTLRSVAGLASIYINEGRWIDVENLGVQVIAPGQRQARKRRYSSEDDGDGDNVFA